MELSHVSDVVRQWSNHIYKILKESDRNLKTVTIRGDVDPELYDVFSVDFFVIKIDDKMHRYGGAYDENASGYKNGKYYVYLILGSFMFDKFVLNHELRHAYEDYKRRSKGRPGLGNSKEGVLLFSGDFSDLFLNSVDHRFAYFKEVLKGLYFTSKIEESAYSETVYDDLPIIGQIKQLMNVDYVNYWKKMYSQKEFERNWIDFKSEFNIPILNRFKDYESFLIWSNMTIKNRGNRILKKFLKINYLKNNESNNK